MYIGGGIALLVVGAVLAFAVNDRSIGAVDVGMIGWIFMAGGLAAIVLSFLYLRPRAAASSVEVVQRRDMGGPRS